MEKEENILNYIYFGPYNDGLRKENSEFNLDLLNNKPFAWHFFREGKTIYNKFTSSEAWKELALERLKKSSSYELCLVNFLYLYFEKLISSSIKANKPLVNYEFKYFLAYVLAFQTLTFSFVDNDDSTSKMKVKINTAFRNDFRLDDISKI